MIAHSTKATVMKGKLTPEIKINTSRKPKNLVIG